MPWECGIDGCGAVFDDPESLVVHQVNTHDGCECKVCGTVVPDGYLAIRHAFTEHSRAEYVRAYGASAADIRQREELIEELEEHTDVNAITSQSNG
ncbi:DUF7565 family protein [Natronobiforma cellulositropha]|uniref:DUF7565 family protein n=1 Tax=Natronobiforma cellulositropha TaxID=1679076 RepID=UPI0021D5D90D|nr:hypothetical protein [Natronobiforma cellulositropha]